MNKLILFLTLCFLTFQWYSLEAQKTINYCSVVPDGGFELVLNEPDAKLVCDGVKGSFTHKGKKEVMNYIDAILDEVGLFRNFDIIGCDETDNAYAFILEFTDGKMGRYIMYDNGLFDYVRAKVGDDWGRVAILAHELGHHLNGHTLIPGGSRPPTELEADYFAGFVVGKLGGSLKDAQDGYRAITVFPEETPSHPALKDRLKAIERGYNKAIQGVMVAQDEGPMTAERVLSRYIEAIGGEEVVANLKYIDATRILHYVNNGNEELNFKAQEEIHYYRPAAYYVKGIDSRTPEGYEKVQIGVNSYLVDANGNWKPSAMNAYSGTTQSEQMKAIKSSSYIEEYGLLISGIPMGVEKVNLEGLDYWAVILPAERQYVKLMDYYEVKETIRYYDASTYLLQYVQETISYENTSFEPWITTTIYGNYSPAGKILMPYYEHLIYFQGDRQLNEFMSIYTEIKTDKLLGEMNFLLLMRDLDLYGEHPVR